MHMVVDGFADSAPFKKAGGGGDAGSGGEAGGWDGPERGRSARRSPSKPSPSPSPETGSRRATRSSSFTVSTQRSAPATLASPLVREQEASLAEASVQQIVTQVDAKLALHTRQQHENMTKELEAIRRNLARSQTPADAFESYAKEQQAYITKEMAELRASLSVSPQRRPNAGAGAGAPRRRCSDSELDDIDEDGERQAQLEAKLDDVTSRNQALEAQVALMRSLMEANLRGTAPGMAAGAAAAPRQQQPEQPDPQPKPEQPTPEQPTPEQQQQQQQQQAPRQEEDEEQTRRQQAPLQQTPLRHSFQVQRQGGLATPQPLSRQMSAPGGQVLVRGLLPRRFTESVLLPGSMQQATRSPSREELGSRLTSLFPEL